MGMLQWTIQHGCCMTILSDAFHVYNAYFYNHVIGLKWQWMKVKLLLLAYRINGTVCPLSSFMMDFEPDKISRKSLSLDTYWYDLICIHITGADILEKPSIFIYLWISKHFIELECSSPSSQEPVTGPYPESDESSPVSLQSILILFTPMLLCHTGLSSYGFLDKTLYAFLLSPLHASWFAGLDHSNHIQQVMKL